MRKAARSLEIVVLPLAIALLALNLFIPVAGGDIAHVAGTREVGGVLLVLMITVVVLTDTAMVALWVIHEGPARVEHR